MTANDGLNREEFDRMDTGANGTLDVEEVYSAQQEKDECFHKLPTTAIQQRHKITKPCNIHSLFSNLFAPNECSQIHQLPLPCTAVVSK
mmetsp:Transcript_35795/g.65904  ORF Transcript_35795/g.65904 Transcript_35795/m.65904 type:complete len:89 (-) Transcript_35795:384-650(-)